MNKICVAGCSFSDYTKIDVCYGEYLANICNREYVHESAGCGSNYRIWRRIHNLVINQIITSSDILIVQYTAPERTEFFTRFIDEEQSNKDIKKQPIREKYRQGEIVRYKNNSWSWSQNKKEKDFLRLYEENHLDINFIEEQFEYHHDMFQHFLKAHDIPTVFFLSKYMPAVTNYFSLLPEFQKLSYTNTTSSSQPYNLTENDDFHMNQQGHINLAKDIKIHLHKVGLI